MTFAGRLVVGTLAVIVVALVILVAGVEFALRRDLEQDIRTTLFAEAQLVAQLLDADSTAWQRQVERIGRQTGRRITLIATDGRVVAESDEPAETVPRIENHAGRPEVRAALETGLGSSHRVSATVDRDLLYVAIRGG
ncbi:MAG TPA: hypothetical protein VNH46_05100, partial [Gemmatimonadales bacterium]|nr:hypothetical protein [Gemmatimonadales bacterium]